MDKIRLNDDIINLPPSSSIAFMQRAKKMKETDKEIIDLAGGEPDFDTPERIKEELIKQVSDNYTHYTVGPGLPELRKRIAQKFREENSIQCDENDIIVTPGGKCGIYLAVRAIVNPGDEVMIIKPGWVSYEPIVQAAGGVAIDVRLRYDNNYVITDAVLENAVTSRTKLLILNYPNNPTGRVLSEDEIEVIRKFMQKHPEILVISDEIYEKVIYEGNQHISIASFSEIVDRVITINGFSKSCAMTGWRMGYLCAKGSVRDAIYNLFQHSITCVSGFIQKAGIVALDCQDEMEEMRREYEERGKAIVERLNTIEGIECRMPQGAFYIWVNFDIPDMSTEQICEFLLKEAKVVGVPGNSYGETEKKCVRFSFAAPKKELLDAAARIGSVMEQIRK